MGYTLTIRLNESLAAWLQETSAKTGLSRAQIVRAQLEKAKARSSAKPFMRLAGSIRGLPKNLSRGKGFSTR